MKMYLLLVGKMNHIGNSSKGLLALIRKKLGIVPSQSQGFFGSLESLSHMVFDETINSLLSGFGVTDKIQNICGAVLQKMQDPAHNGLICFFPIAAIRVLSVKKSL